MENKIFYDQILWARFKSQSLRFLDFNTFRFLISTFGQSWIIYRHNRNQFWVWPFLAEINKTCNTYNLTDWKTALGHCSICTYIWFRTRFISCKWQFLTVSLFPSSEMIHLREKTFQHFFQFSQFSRVIFSEKSAHRSGKDQFSL